MKLIKIDKRIKGYTWIHKWLVKEYGKACKCENDKCPRVYNRYEWALIHGKNYEKNRNNFKMLCSSCHRKYDKVNVGRVFTKEEKTKMSLSRIGRKGTYGFLGKEHSDKTKKKMSKNHGRYWLGKKHSEATKKKMRLAKKKNI